MYENFVANSRQGESVSDLDRADIRLAEFKAIYSNLCTYDLKPTKLF